VQNKCEYSTLTIPNEPAYARAAAGYIIEIAKIIGFVGQDLNAISEGVRQAIVAQMRYSFEPGEKAVIEISCERIVEGLKIVLKDKGLPFDDSAVSAQSNKPPSSPASSFGRGILGLKKHMHEVLLHNLGSRGKEIVLVKHLKNKDITDYCAACELEPYEESDLQIQSDPKQRQCTVRRMKPEEAVEVSKSIYKTYGYTYPHEFIYYPEKIAALNESGRIHSAVAVMDGKDVAGHCALYYWEDNPGIAEMVAGVVNPEFRSHGCLTKLTDYLIERAQSEGLSGILGEAVTNHVISQRTGHQHHLNDCAVLLGMLPLKASFRGFSEMPSGKISMVMAFRYLKSARPVSLFLPLQDENIIRKIYEGFGKSPKIKWQENEKNTAKQKQSVFRINVLGALSYAKIIIDDYGQAIESEIQLKLKELRLKKIEVIHLYLNLADPLTPHFCPQFEKLGFFFGGVLPGGLKDGDALILQYLNNVPVDYDAIQLESDIAKKILEHIREHDPN
jgi:serine/threonine-protein kinase RsbW